MMMMNKQNAFVFQISTKFGGLVPSVMLLSHTYFGCMKFYGFGIVSHTFFQSPCTIFLTVTFLKISVRRNVAFHLVRHKYKILEGGCPLTKVKGRCHYSYR